MRAENRETKAVVMHSAKQTAADGVLSFAFGGISGMVATCVVQPVDLIKNRMQLAGSSPNPVAKTSFGMFNHIVKTEGAMSLYNGLSAGLFRQATYTMSRLGIYSALLNWASDSTGKPPESFMAKAGLGMAAGGLASIIGNPSEVCLIRMTSDGRLPLDQRRNYRHVFDALARITREEGISTLWRGCTPTIIRAMVVNAAQLGSYSQAKQLLVDHLSFGRSDTSTHLVASLISGFVCTVASMPVDITKTRIQTMKIVDGVPEYKGPVDVLQKVVRNEGFFSLWKGFTPYFLRLGPHTVLCFIFLEKLNGWFLGGRGL